MSYSDGACAALVCVRVPSHTSAPLSADIAGLLDCLCVSLVCMHLMLFTDATSMPAGILDQSNCVVATLACKCMVMYTDILRGLAFEQINTDPRRVRLFQKFVLPSFSVQIRRGCAPSPT